MTFRLLKLVTNAGDLAAAEQAFAHTRAAIRSVYGLDIDRPEALGLAALPPLRFRDVGAHMPFCLGCVLYYRGIGMLIAGRHPEAAAFFRAGADAALAIRCALRELEFDDGDTESVSKKYGPVATPHVFVFDAARKLRYAGAIDDNERIEKVTKHYLRDALTAMLEGKEPPVAQTKVVGCSTKWAGKESVVQSYLARLAAEPVSLTSADAAALRELRAGSTNKFRLVNFWATWCAPCVAEFDEFVTINRMYRGRDFEMVLVSMNQPDEEKPVLEFLKKQQASNRNLLFASADRETLINAFNPKWPGPVPYTVLLSPGGEIVYEELGSIDPLAVKRAIVKALNERKPWPLR